MGKLIQFPTGKIISSADIEHTEEEFQAHGISDDGVELSKHLVAVIEEELEVINVDWLDGFNMSDTKTIEHKDAYVLANLFYSILVRYTNMDHLLHDDLDDLFEKIKLQQATNDDIT